MDYRDIIVDSLNYCIRNKGLKVYAWVIMTNHIHIVCSCEEPFRISEFLRDFKKFTSRQIMIRISEIGESRRYWLRSHFSFNARRIGRAKNFKIWRDDNHAINLNDIDIVEKINYIHENPVKAGLVFESQQYVYSSAIDYSGKKGLVMIELV